MATAECNYFSGGGAEKPTLLWSDNSGTNSTISSANIDYSNYQYLIFVTGCSGGSSSWATNKKTTLCDKSVKYHMLAMCGMATTSAYTYMTVGIENGGITFPYKEQTYDLCYAIYGCNSLSIDYTDIWASGNIA